MAAHDPADLPTHDTAAKYRSLWGTSSKEKTTLRDDGNKAERVSKAPEIADAYYDLITDNYQGGWGESFHYCTFLPGDSWEIAISRHEHWLGLIMGLKPGMRVLDAGCGIGGPSRSIAAFACVHVTGVSINNMQLARMKELTEEAGLTDRVVGVHGNFSGLDGVRLPFPDNHFDAVFSFESLCHAPDLKACYTELRRVCKPGGTLAFFEECITPLYDKSNTEHQEMVGRLERGGGLAHLPTAVDCRKALDEAGWKLEYDEDRALIPEYQVVPWYYPLDGDMRYPTARGDRMRTWLMKEGPWNVLRIMWKVLCTLHLCHPGRYEAITTCAQWVYGCRDAGKLGIFTPFHVFVAKNPQ